VTTWSDKTGAAKIAEEHLLLGQAVAWLSRFPVIPPTFFQGSLVGQPFPPPTLVAQMDANKNAGEFWTALGSTPRPAFYLSVTISMALGLETPEGPPVVTKEMILKKKMPTGIAEPVLADFFEIGGTVRNANTLAVIANAQVTILELQRAAITDVAGRFRFNELNAGNYTLRTAATGFTTLNKAIVVPGAVLDAYDVNLTP
jgi:hypothetical protein